MNWILQASTTAVQHMLPLKGTVFERASLLVCKAGSHTASALHQQSVLAWMTVSRVPQWAR